MLLCAYPVGVLEDAAEVEHGKHGDNHHNTLEQQCEFKLLSHPARMRTQTEVISNDRNQLKQKNEHLFAHKPCNLMDWWRFKTRL